MLMHLVGVDKFSAVHKREGSLAARIVTKTISIIVGLTCKIAEEVVFIIGQDLRHGLIEREREDWER